MLYDDLERCGGGVGREAQEEGNIFVLLVRFVLLYGINHHDIVKQFSSN